MRYFARILQSCLTVVCVCVATAASDGGIGETATRYGIDGNGNTCPLCPAGFEKANGQCDDPCSACLHGTFQPGDRLSCRPCQPEDCAIYYRETDVSCTSTTDTVCGVCQKGHLEMGYKHCVADKAIGSPPITTESPPNGQKSSSGSAPVYPIILLVVGSVGVIVIVALAVFYPTIWHARHNEARADEDGENIPLQTELSTLLQEDEVNRSVSTDKVVPSQTMDIDEVRHSHGDLTHRDASSSITHTLSMRQELENEQIISTFEERGEQHNKNNSGSRSQASPDGGKTTDETVMKTIVDNPPLEPTSSGTNRFCIGRHASTSSEASDDDDDMCGKKEVDPLLAGGKSTRAVANGLEGSPAVIGGLSNQESDQVTPAATPANAVHQALDGGAPASGPPHTLASPGPSSTLRPCRASDLSARSVSAPCVYPAEAVLCVPHASSAQSVLQATLASPVSATTPATVPSLSVQATALIQHAFQHPERCLAIASMVLAGDSAQFAAAYATFTAKSENVRMSDGEVDSEARRATADDDNDDNSNNLEAGAAAAADMPSTISNRTPAGASPRSVYCQETCHNVGRTFNITAEVSCVERPDSGIQWPGCPVAHSRSSSEGSLASIEVLDEQNGADGSRH